MLVSTAPALPVKLKAFPCVAYLDFANAFPLGAITAGPRGSFAFNVAPLPGELLGMTLAVQVAFLGTAIPGSLNLTNGLYATVTR